MKYNKSFLKRSVLILSLFVIFSSFSEKAFSQLFLDKSASDDPAYPKIVDFIRERKLDDSDSSNLIRTANFIIPTYSIVFRLPESYKGNLDGGSLAGVLLIDEDGFCEEFAILKNMSGEVGLDKELNSYAISYFKNMPRVSFQKLDLPDKPNGSIKRERKAFPVIVTFVSKNREP